VLPGSLDATASLVEAAGRRCVPLPLDLLDLASLAPTVDRAVTELGHLDVLVNNAIYVGPGNDRKLVDNDPQTLIDRVTGNVTAQLLITQRALRPMVERGRGLIVNITSAAGINVPAKPAGEGGWSLAYAVTKAGFNRIADMVDVEHRRDGIRTYSVNPGQVATERVLAAGEALAWVAKGAAAPEVIGRVVAWLADAPEGTIRSGSYVEAQDLARILGWL
jgi:3-oxoacyl-[acyl-carrier protein] reductase